MRVSFEVTGRGNRPAHVFGRKLLGYVAEHYPAPQSVIDVGAGRGITSSVFLACKYDVTGISLGDAPSASLANAQYTHVKQSLFDVDLPQADIVWCSHVVEHVTDAGMFLTKCRWLVKPGGLFCIVVPSDPTDLLIDGHLSFWTPAHLIINLVHAGFNCKKAKWYTEGRDIALIIRRDDMPLVDLNYDQGDLRYLSPYFPCPLIPRSTNPWLADNFQEWVAV